MLLSKKIFLFVILLFVLLNATACTSENGTVKNKDENIQSLNSTFTSLITATNKYDETNYVSEINKDNINSENDSKFILNGVGEIKWENEESPSICIISNNKTFNVYCIDGFFPPADHYLEYKIINYEKNDYILLHCENQHKRWYYILDGNFKNILFITMDNSDPCNIKLVKDSEISLDMDNLLNIIQNEILKTKSISEVDLNNIEDISKLEDLPIEIKNNVDYQKAITDISNIAKENCGPYYIDNAIYSIININNNESLILFKIMNASPTLLECHMFYINNNGSYVDCGTNRALYSGFEAVNDLSICSSRYEQLLLLHTVDDYKTDANDVTTFFNSDGEMVFLYSECNNSYTSTINIEMFDERYYDEVSELFLNQFKTLSVSIKKD